MLYLDTDTAEKMGASSARGLSRCPFTYPDLRAAWLIGRYESTMAEELTIVFNTEIH